MKKILGLLTIILAALALTGCDNLLQDNNQPPVAGSITATYKVGNNSDTIQNGATNAISTDSNRTTIITLTAVGDSDPEGDELTYEWQVEVDPLMSENSLPSEKTGKTFTIKTSSNNYDGETVTITATYTVSDGKNTDTSEQFRFSYLQDGI